MHFYLKAEGGFGGSGKDPGEKAGDTWARVRRQWAKLYFVDRHGVW